MIGIPNKKENLLLLIFLNKVWTSSYGYFKYIRRIVLYNA